jgi:hypothetical protein
MKMRPLFVFVFLTSASMCISCASANYHLRVDLIGQSRDARQVEEDAKQMKSAEAEDVQVVYELPAGVTSSKKGIQVTRDSAFELVAKLRVSIDDSYSILTFFGLWGYDYPSDENWRNGLCCWQIPISWITLTLWAWYSPLYWPCRVSESNDASDVNDRKKRMINMLKRATRAADGTVLFISRLGNTAPGVPGNSGPSMHSLDMVSAAGYAFRKRQ